MKFKYIFIMFFILLFMPHANACTVNGSTQYNLTNAAIRFSMVYHFDGISNFGGGDTLYCYNDTDGWHNLTVIPTDYILINISRWNMRDDHRKTFNESCNITTATTNHVITGYPSNGAINVYINSTFYENVNIEDGIFTWLYSDGYLDEIYEIDLLYSNITASFNVTKNEGIDPLSVQFIDTSTNATSWYWDFGDGETSTAKNPYHTYNVDGVYTVTLNASNSGGYDIEYKTNYITVTSRFAESSGIASTSAEMMLICSVLIISTMAVAGLRGKIEINELITFSIGMIFIMVVIYLMHGIATVIQNTFS